MRSLQRLHHNLLFLILCHIHITPSNLNSYFYSFISKHTTENFFYPTKRNQPMDEPNRCPSLQCLVVRVIDCGLRHLQTDNVESLAPQFRRTTQRTRAA